MSPAQAASTETTDKYLKYLDDFSDTVNKAATRLIQSG